MNLYDPSYLIKESQFSTGLESGFFSTSVSATLQNPDYENTATWKNEFRWASFEQDRFVIADASIDESERLIFPNSVKDLGIITTAQSDKNGNFATPIVITLQSTDTYINQTGLTVVCANFIESATIKAYRDSVLVASEDFDGNQTIENDDGYFKTQQFLFNFDTANKIELIIRKIDRPFNFFYLVDIKLGTETTFETDVLMSLEATNKFSLYGDVLEYGTLNFNLFKPELSTRYTFLKNEKITLTDGITKFNFYTRSFEESRDRKQVSASCEDFVSFFEKQYMGGFFENKPFFEVFDSICTYAEIGTSGTYFCRFDPSLFGVKVTGFIPPGTVRDALKHLMLISNVRLYKEPKSSTIQTEAFKLFENTLNDKAYDESNIIADPLFTRNEQISRVVIREHHYAQNNEETEIYHFKAIADARVTFNEPLWGFRVFEEKTEGESVEVSADQYIIHDPECNQIKFVTSTSFPIIVTAKKYTDSVVEYTSTVGQLAANSDFSEVNLDFYANSEKTQEICDFLLELYLRPYAIKFMTLERPELGGYYNILGYNLNICAVTEKNNGVFEVEAR